jgi:hypothetical protein
VNKHDLTTWLTKPEAAAAIGVSPKMIEKYAAAGKLHHGRRTQNGRPALVDYHAGDVERLRQERQPQPKPFVVPRLRHTTPATISSPMTVSAPLYSM